MKTVIFMINVKKRVYNIGLLRKDGRSIQMSGHCYAGTHRLENLRESKENFEKENYHVLFADENGDYYSYNDILKKIN